MAGLVSELETIPQVEKTFALIKPDAVAAGKARDIMHLIEHHGFTIVTKKRMQVRSPIYLREIIM